MSPTTTLDKPYPAVVVGVDTHADTHTACVLDADNGARLATHTFPTSGAGYQALLAWASNFGTISQMGIEQTGSYGAALARAARTAGIHDLVEINQPSQQVRATKGKTDALDAESAARSLLNGTAIAVAKDTNGIIESIRLIKVARASAVKDRTAAMNQLRSIVITVEDDLREELRNLAATALINTCARLRPDRTRLSDPTQAAKRALRSIAKRIQSLTQDVNELHADLDALTIQAVPTLRAESQIGPVSAADLVIAFGGKGRITSHAAFARLTGVAPIPASSGKTDRHRLHRGGNRQANKALHMIVVGRIKSDPRTRTYIDERTPTTKDKKKGNQKPAIRSLKRHIVRRCWRLINHDLNRT